MKAVLIVIDSFGIGEMPDSAQYGDAGSNTYANIYKQTGVKLENLVELGLNNIDGVEIGGVKSPLASYARLAEKTPAKDTTAGHYELAGVVMDKPYRTYKRFPDHIVEELERQANCRFIGNEVASGTEIINRLGEEHRRTRRPILYTSADSVLQIAADTEIIPLERLYNICVTARRIMAGDNAVGRIIARPFIKTASGFVRTPDRKDYALEPPEDTMLDKMKAAGLDVIGVGKISDIFCGRGITESHKAKNNAQGIEKTLELLKRDISGLIFVNLVDTDMLYGHRNDTAGYANSLKEFDLKLPEILKLIKEDDILMITADHGCDPTTPSTDHSREYVPLIIYGKAAGSKNHGTINGFDIVSKTLLNYFGVEKSKESLI